MLKDARTITVIRGDGDGVDVIVNGIVQRELQAQRIRHEQQRKIEQQYIRDIEEQLNFIMHRQWKENAAKMQEIRKMVQPKPKKERGLKRLWTGLIGWCLRVF